MSLPQNQPESFNGKPIVWLTLRNSSGMEVDVTNYGARLASIRFANGTGDALQLIAGYNSLEEFLRSTETYYGCVVGRYANRIAYGRFALDGKEYQVPTNLPPHHLHGGPQGFHHQAWTVCEVEEGKSILLHYVSPDGEEDFPGNLKVWVRYTLDEENAVHIEYRASTDAPTILNITNHAYFNLNGIGSGDVLGHHLRISADEILPTDAQSIPTGDRMRVEGTAFDFREVKAIGQNIFEEDVQLVQCKGYDHNFILKESFGPELNLVATAIGDLSGIQMDVYTDQPGVQLYTGNFMSGQNLLFDQWPDEQYHAFCLETQHWPDAPNQPGFPSVRLDPGEEFRSKTVYGFEG